MSELNEPHDATVVRPSIPQDHLGGRMRQLDETIQRTDTLSRINDIQSGVIYQFGKMLIDAGICDQWPIRLESFQLEMGPRSRIEKIDTTYLVNQRPNTMGS